MFPWSKFKSATTTLQKISTRCQKMENWVLSLSTREVVHELMLRWFSAQFLHLTVYFSLLRTWQIVFSLSLRPQTEYTRQLWNRWLFLREILWPLKTKVVTGRTAVWTLSRLESELKKKKIVCPCPYKCCPGTHGKDNEPRTSLVEQLTVCVMSPQL